MVSFSLFPLIRHFYDDTKREDLNWPNQVKWDASPFTSVGGYNKSWAVEWKLYCSFFMQFNKCFMLYIVISSVDEGCYYGDESVVMVISDGEAIRLTLITARCGAWHTLVLVWRSGTPVIIPRFMPFMPFLIDVIHAMVIRVMKGWGLGVEQVPWLTVQLLREAGGGAGGAGGGGRSRGGGGGAEHGTRTFDRRWLPLVPVGHIATNDNMKKTFI